MPLRNPWQSFDAEKAKKLEASTGVYELADDQGNVLYIGFAGGRSQFGLRGEIAQRFSPAETNPALAGLVKRFRYEITSVYYSRWVEVLSRYVEEHGELPPGNRESGEFIPKLGRFVRSAG